MGECRGIRKPPPRRPEHATDYISSMYQCSNTELASIQMSIVEEICEIYVYIFVNILVRR